MSLHKQLRKAGAKPQEAKDLAAIAAHVARTKPKGLSERARSGILATIVNTPDKARKSRKPLLWGLACLATAASAVAIVTFGVLNTNSTLPLTQEVEQTENDTLTTEQLEFIDNLAKQRQAELKELKKSETAADKIQELEKKYESRFDEFWSRHYDKDDERRSRYYQRLLETRTNSWVDHFNRPNSTDELER